MHVNNDTVGRLFVYAGLIKRACIAWTFLEARRKWKGKQA